MGRPLGGILFCLPGGISSGRLKSAASAHVLDQSAFRERTSEGSVLCSRYGVKDIFAAVKMFLWSRNDLGRVTVINHHQNIDVNTRSSLHQVITQRGFLFPDWLNLSCRLGSRSPPNASQPPAFFSKQEMIKKMTVVGNEAEFSESDRIWIKGTIKDLNPYRLKLILCFQTRVSRELRFSTCRRRRLQVDHPQVSDLLMVTGAPRGSEADFILGLYSPSCLSASLSCRGTRDRPMPPDPRDSWELHRSGGHHQEGLDGKVRRPV